MSVTVSYQFSAIHTVDVAPATSVLVDMAPSAGGYVVTLTNGSQHQLKSYFGADDLFGTTAPASGNDPHVATFQDPSFKPYFNPAAVVVAQTTNGIAYSIYDLNRVPGGNGVIGTSADTAPDVAGLQGTNSGYVIVNQHAGGTSGNDVAVHLRPNVGADLDLVVDGTAADDRAPVVAGLADGGFAVAWERHVGASTQAWVAVYNADGSIRRAATAFDTTGSVNQGLAITALDAGGFAITYADNQWGPSDAIHSSVAFFNGAGTLKNLIHAPFGGPQETRQDITQLSNGYVVTVSTDTTDQFFNTTRLSVIDPATGAILQTGLLGGSHSSTRAAGLAGLDQGDFVAGFQYDDSIDEGTVGNQLTHYNFVRTAVGDDDNNTIVGDSLIDFQYGAGGNDILSGGGSADTMSGGAGDDIYYSDGPDTIVEGLNEGHDVVRATADSGLAENVEDLFLLGGQVGSGNELDNKIVGNARANYLFGRAGDDWLDGAAGDDTMEGGAGDDTYIVHEKLDKVIEGVDEGTDTVKISFTYRLAANLENLVLTGTEAINGYGNASDNKITGNAANNALTGEEGNDWLDGGAGVDVMAGGAGDDTYVVRDVGDRANEGADAGFDTVRASISFTLLANVEKLQLLGTADLNGTGNGLANTLVGNGGNNILNGAAGADAMSGGKGDDIYYADNVGDKASEGADSGHDLVNASVTFTLANNIEDLTLTGAGAINGTGNALSNLITGNSGKNTLNGAAGDDQLVGGLGNDTLYGGLGADTFLYTAGDGNDQLLDFSGPGGDRVELHGVTVATLVNNIATLSDGSHLTAAAGYHWTSSDFHTI